MSLRVEVHERMLVLLRPKRAMWSIRRRLPIGSLLPTDVERRGHLAQRHMTTALSLSFLSRLSLDCVNPSRVGIAADKS